jgi:branched-chain amino acid transport system substrate-binding protein
MARWFRWPVCRWTRCRKYEAEYTKRFGTPVETYSPYAYDGAMAMFAAMKTANSTDPAKYLPMLAKTAMPSITSKSLAYDEYGDLKNGGITVYKVVGGKWTTLQTIGGR